MVIAKILMDSGTQLVTEKQFSDALETAGFSGNVEIVEQLLSGNAGLFTPNITPDSLQVALFGGKSRKAERLRKDCVDINEEKGYFGNTLAAAMEFCPLTVARSFLCISSAKYCVKRPCCPEARRSGELLRQTSYYASQRRRYSLAGNG